VRYTNAGNPPLLNRSLRAVFSEDKLFATSPTTGDCDCRRSKTCWLTDTVVSSRSCRTDLSRGVQDTLEEVVHAIWLLHVWTSAHPQPRNRSRRDLVLAEMRGGETDAADLQQDLTSSPAASPP